MASNIVRATAVMATAAVAGSLGFAFHAQDETAAAHRDAAAWQQEIDQWQTLTDTAVTHDRRVARENARLVARYNKLVKQTDRSTRKLVAAMKKAGSTRTVVAQQQTVYRTTTPAVAAAPTPVASAPSAPISRTS